jgi:hypothetical protein
VKKDNPFLRNISKANKKTIKTSLARTHWDKVVDSLELITEQQMSPQRAAAQLHRLIGEGNSWYWRMQIRSQAALVYNEAFREGSVRWGYEQYEWDAASNACEICAWMDGKVWKIGEGPEPVTDTHPHCGCMQRSVWVVEEGMRLQKPYDRESPYERSFSKDELAQIRLENELRRQGRIQ